MLEAREAFRALYSDSIDRPVRGSDGNDHPLRDTLGDADTRLDAVFEQAELDSLLHRLDERERTIVVLYFHGGMTQKEIGSRLGLSQMHISRLLRAGAPAAAARGRVMAGHDGEAAERAADPGDVRTQISNGLVALLREYYGRGPERTRTYVSDDLVVCVLRGGFTRVEQTLLESGHGGDVIRQRMVFQDVMRERFEEVVEKATGRKVIGFMSGNQQDPDMICEVFVLERRRPR